MTAFIRRLLRRRAVNRQIAAALNAMAADLEREVDARSANGG